jgi:2-iminobutanoate/2-iminopropanoate deaminase
MRRIITSDKGAPPIGPYSPAIMAGGPTLYVAGQGPVDPDSGEFRFGSFEEQAKLTFDNVSALLEAAGTSWAHVVRVGVFLADLDNFTEMNKIYEAYLTEPYPARTTVQVVLPAKMAIEVDCIAVIPEV